MTDEPETTAPRPRGRPRKIVPDTPATRPPMHPPMKSADPRRDADARAKEIMDHLGTIPDATDEFYLPQWAVPDGWSYEWKRYSILNQEDTTHLNRLRDTGWEPVPASRHRSDGSNIVPVGYKHKDDSIVRNGQILMERPQAITDAMKKRDSQAAKTLLDIAGRVDPNKVQAFDLDNSGTPIRAHGVAGAKRSYSPMPIPD
jgi:hypothetical protein